MQEITLPEVRIVDTTTTSTLFKSKTKTKSKINYSIEIPIDIMPRTQMSIMCDRFDCSLLPARRGDAYYRITSENATNFFWLGANINNGTINNLIEEINR